MKSIEKNSFDVVLVIAHVLHLATGGDHEVTRLTRRLVRDEFKVSIIYLRNPEKNLTNIIDEPTLKEFLSKRPFIHTLYYTVLATKIGFKVFVPILRKLKGIDFKEDYRGAKVYFMKDLNVNIKSRAIIAQSFEPAFFVDALNFHGDKFYRIHHSFDDPSFSGDLSTLAAKSFTLPLKKIVENDIVEKRFEADKPIRIHIGVDTEIFPCYNNPENRAPIVLLPLRRNKSKGSVYGITAMQELHAEYPDLKIISFGNLSMKEIPEFIDYRGVVSLKELVELYNSASITVIPSIVEGTSLPALEAMNCGSAVVSTKNEGVDSFATDGYDSILVPIRDSDAIVKNVKALLQDENLRIEIARNGMKTAKNYSYDRSYEELITGMGLK